MLRFKQLRLLAASALALTVSMSAAQAFDFEFEDARSAKVHTVMDNQELSLHFTEAKVQRGDALERYCRTLSAQLPIGTCLELIGVSNDFANPDEDQLGWQRQLDNIYVGQVLWLPTAAAAQAYAEVFGSEAEAARLELEQVNRLREQLGLGNLTQERVDNIEQALLAYGEVVDQLFEELEGNISGLSERLDGKVDQAQFDALLARIEAGEVMNQAQFNAMLRSFLAEENVALDDIRAVREVAESAFDEVQELRAEQERQGVTLADTANRTTALEAEQAQLAETQQQQGETLVAVADRTGTLEERVTAVETASGSEVPWWHWALAALAGLIAIVLAMLYVNRRWINPLRNMAKSAADAAGRVEIEINPIKDRLTEVEDQIGFLMELDARGRFNNPDLTADMIENMNTPHDPIVLRVKCRDGKHRQVHVIAGKDNDGTECLNFPGLQDGHDRVHKKTLVALQKHLAKAVRGDWVIGILAARKVA